MPAEIATAYTEIPTALIEHAGALDLTLADVGFVGLLWSFKWYADSKINPSMDTLAERMATSTDTVSRHVKRLESRGLLGVRRAGQSKRSPIAEYDLSPLWEAVAERVREARPALRVVRGSADRVRESADWASANLRMEVDEVEVDELSSPSAHTREATAEDQIALLRREAFASDTYPSTRVRLLEQADKLEKRERHRVKEGRRKRGHDHLAALGVTFDDESKAERRAREDDGLAALGLGDIGGAIDSTAEEIPNPDVGAWFGGRNL